MKRGTGIVDHGDSGGSLGNGTTILGTASCITNDWPRPYEAYYGRVDAAAPWIDATLTTWKARWHFPCTVELQKPLRRDLPAPMFQASCRQPHPPFHAARPPPSAHF